MSKAQLQAALRAIIEREHAALDRVITILRAEQRELSAQKPVEIEALTQSKSIELAGINALRSERLAALDRLGIPRDPYRAAVALAAVPELASAWARLQKAADEAMLVNTLNAKLVAIRLNLVSGRLEALRGAVGRKDLYAADGRSGGGTSGRVIGAA